MSHSYTPNGSIYDDFRDATVGASLSGASTDSGHAWTQYKGTWQIEAGTGWPGTADGNTGTSVPSSTFGRLGIDFGSADVDIEATLERPKELATSGGLLLRRTAAGYYIVAATPTQVVIEHRPNDDSTSTNLATYSGLTVGDLSVLRAVASGSTISAYLDDDLLGSVTDSTYSGTVHGLYQRFSGNDSFRFYAFNMHPVPVSGILVGSVAL